MSYAPARDRARRLAELDRPPPLIRDALAGPVLLAVLAALGPCTAADLERQLGCYSPGADRLAAILRGLVGTGAVRSVDCFESDGGLLVAVPVFSVRESEE